MLGRQRGGSTLGSETWTPETRGDCTMKKPPLVPDGRKQAFFIISVLFLLVLLAAIAVHAPAASTVADTWPGFPCASRMADEEGISRLAIKTVSCVASALP